MPHDPEGMQLTPREAQQHPDTAQLIDRLDTALAERDHWRQREREARERDEVGQAALKQCKTELAAALALVERMQWAGQRVITERNEARIWARRLLAHNSELTRALLAAVPPIDIHKECPHCGVCLDCGGPLETVRPGKVQCPDAGVCQRCGHVTHDGVCSGGCYPRDYSEQP